jgi:hypothetical protein
MSNAYVLFLNERDAPSVEQQPRVNVHSWRAVKAMTGALHLSIHLGGITLRITSPVATILLPEAIAVTSSGRAYWLNCPPETDDTLKRLILANAQRAGFPEHGDVSEELWAQIEASRPGIVNH